MSQLCFIRILVVFLLYFINVISCERCRKYGSVDGIRLEKVKTFNFCSIDRPNHANHLLQHMDATVMNGKFYVACYELFSNASMHHGYTIYDVLTGEEGGNVEMPPPAYYGDHRNVFANPLNDELFTLENGRKIWKIVPHTGIVHLWKSYPFAQRRIDKLSTSSASGHVMLIQSLRHRGAMVYTPDGSWLYNVTLPDEGKPTSYEVFEYNSTRLEGARELKYLVETPQGTYVLFEDLQLTGNYTEIDRFGRILRGYSGQTVGGESFSTVMGHFTMDSNGFFYVVDLAENIYALSRDLNIAKRVYDGSKDLKGSYTPQILYDQRTGLIILEHDEKLTTFNIVDDHCSC